MGSAGLAMTAVAEETVGGQETLADREARWAKAGEQSSERRSPSSQCPEDTKNTLNRGRRHRTRHLTLSKMTCTRHGSTRIGPAGKCRTRPCSSLRIRREKTLTMRETRQLQFPTFGEMKFSRRIPMANHSRCIYEGLLLHCPPDAQEAQDVEK